jgi:hypothetical protein
MISAFQTVSQEGTLSYIWIVTQVKKSVESTNSRVTEDCCKMHKLYFL